MNELFLTIAGAVVMIFFIIVLAFMAIAVIKGAIVDFSLNGFDWSDFMFYFILAGAPICLIVICAVVVACHVL